MSCSTSSDRFFYLQCIIIMYLSYIVYFCFSYDSRQTDSSSNRISNRHNDDRPDLWSEPTAFGDRAHFRVSSVPAMLSVTDVRRFDAATYTCRVDFRQSPTIYHHIKLDVIGKIILQLYYITDRILRMNNKESAFQ